MRNGDLQCPPQRRHSTLSSAPLPRHSPIYPLALIKRPLAPPRNQKAKTSVRPSSSEWLPLLRAQPRTLISRGARQGWGRESPILRPVLLSSRVGASWECCQGSAIRPPLAIAEKPDNDDSRGCEKKKIVESGTRRVQAGPVVSRDSPAGIKGRHRRGSGR